MEHNGGATQGAPTTFTCDLGTACGVYEAVDAATANELKLDCGGDVSDGSNCSGYAYCCYFIGEEASTWTYTNDPYSVEACEAYGDGSC